MAGSLNKASILGNAVKDPEIRNTQAGAKIANLVVATSEQWKDKNSGERKEKSEFHKIVVFNPHLVGIIETHIKKGSKIYVEGAIQTRKWTDQQGMDRYSTEIVMGQYGGTLLILDKGSEPSAAPAQQAAPRQEPTRQPPQQQQSYGGGPLDDEIPFGACWQ